MAPSKVRGSCNANTENKLADSIPYLHVPSPRELSTRACLPLAGVPEAAVSFDKNVLAASMPGRSRFRPMRGKSQLKSMIKSYFVC
jgi:hypothetical protein